MMDAEQRLAASVRSDRQHDFEIGLGRAVAAEVRGTEPSTVGASNRLRIAILTSRTEWMRLISRVASSEWPPSAKSCRRCRPARPPAPRRTGRTGSLPAACAAYALSPDLRRRQRRAVELAVRGQRQPIQHYEAGRHHVVGKQLPDMLPQQPRIRSLATGRHHIGDQALLACDHGCLRHDVMQASAASISPGSMRNPRSFTWWSARPRNSSTPSASPARQVAGAISGSPPGRTDRRRSAPPSVPHAPGSRARAPAPAM